MLVRLYSYILLLGLSVTISFFVSEVDSKNLLLVGFMAFSPLFLLLEKRRFDSVDRMMFLFLLMALGVCLINIGTFRPMSYIYTFCFITSFLFLRDIILKKGFSQDFIVSFLKRLIYAYGIVFIAQQACVLMGSSPILAAAHDYESPWKLPSLTPEPSHLARFLFFIMYTYIVLKEEKMDHRYRLKDAMYEKKIWALYFWMMLTCQSTTALLFVFLIFGRYLRVKTIISFGCITGLILVVIISVFGDNDAFKRILELGPALLTLSPDEINAADHSAAHRILPFFVFLQWLNPATIGFWLGNGMDYGINWCRDYMYMISGDGNYLGDTTNMGGITIMFVDYGIIAMGVLIHSLYKIFRNIPDRFYVVCWIFVNFFSTVNTQIFWFSLLLALILATYKDNDNNRLRNKKLVLRFKDKDYTN